MDYLEECNVLYRFFDELPILKTGETLHTYTAFSHKDKSLRYEKIAVLGPHHNIYKLVNHWNRLIKGDGWTFYI